MKKKTKQIIYLILFYSFLAQPLSAGWFNFNREPDPDQKPNIFKRMGHGINQTVTGWFKKDEPIEVLPIDEEPNKEWIAPITPRPIAFEPVQAAAPAFLEPSPLSPKQYLSEIQKLILTSSQLPPEAKKSALAETVRVYFILYPSGELGKVYIPERYRSEYGFLNEAAITAVYKAARYFKPFPSSMDSEKEKLLSIEIQYKN